MTEAMPFLQKYDITFLRPPTIGGEIFFWLLPGSRSSSPIGEIPAGAPKKFSRLSAGEFFLAAILRYRHCPALRAHNHYLQ